MHVSWYRDPFNTEVDPNAFNPNAKEAEELIEFKVSNAIKLAFNDKTDYFSFWWSLHDPYAVLSQKAFVIIVQFATAYFWEAEFSHLASMKTKSRNPLIVCSDIRLAQCKSEPNIKDLVRRVQEHASQ